MIQIAIMGLGTVGTGVAKVVEENARQIERKRGEEDDRERGRLAEIVIENQKFIEEADRIGDRHPREGGGQKLPEPSRAGPLADPSGEPRGGDEPEQVAKARAEDVLDAAARREHRDTGQPDGHIDRHGKAPPPGAEQHPRQRYEQELQGEVIHERDRHLQKRPDRDEGGKEPAQHDPAGLHGRCHMGSPSILISPARSRTAPDGVSTSRQPSPSSPTALPLCHAPSR